MIPSSRYQQTLAAMKPPVLVGCLLAMGCGAFFCTEIGCYDGLSVTVPSASATPFRVEAFVFRGGAVYGRTCNAAPCVVFFPDFTPAQVRVEVIAGTDSVERAFTPAYEVYRPNGPGCSPECLNAAVTFAP